MDDQLPKIHKTMSKQARNEAREATAAVQALEEERRLRSLKTDRLRQARLAAANGSQGGD